MRRMIVVTGGAGFIGSNIVARLTGEDRYDVVVCDRMETADLAKWKNLAKHPIADFWEPEDLFEQLERHAEAIEAVVHMGAISATTEQDADLIMRTNFILSRDLWDWCSIRDARFIYASSAATYGDGDGGFEDDDSLEGLSALRPLNAYGYSKMLFDQYAARQSDRGQSPGQWAGLKFFNVYGPNEGHKGSMKSVVAQIWPKVAADETVTLFRSHNPELRRRRPDARLRLRRRRGRHHRLAAGDAARLGRVQRRLGSGAVLPRPGQRHLRRRRQDPRHRYVDTPVSIRDRYQYFTEARMERIRAAGYAGQSTPLEEGVRRYVQSYLSQPDQYR
jgi:ADP-L-glycero-D-manno-heptose 6-epimerase